jgi:hypothetical protein
MFKMFKFRPVQIQTLDLHTHPERLDWRSKLWNPLGSSILFTRENHCYSHCCIQVSITCWLPQCYERCWKLCCIKFTFNFTSSYINVNTLEAGRAVGCFRTKYWRKCRDLSKRKIQKAVDIRRDFPHQILQATIKLYNIRWSRRVAGWVVKIMQAAFLVEKHWRKRTLGRTGFGKENKNTMDIKEVTWEKVKWIYLAKDIHLQ